MVTQRELETAVGRLQVLESLTERVQTAPDMPALKAAILDLCEVMRFEMRAALPNEF